MCDFSMGNSLFSNCLKILAAFLEISPFGFFNLPIASFQFFNIADIRHPYINFTAVECQWIKLLLNWFPIDINPIWINCIIATLNKTLLTKYRSIRRKFANTFPVNFHFALFRFNNHILLHH